MRDVLLLLVCRIPWMEDQVKYLGFLLMQLFDLVHLTWGFPIYSKYKYPLTQRHLPFSSSFLSSFFCLADSSFSSYLPQPKVVPTGLVSLKIQSQVNIKHSRNNWWGSMAESREEPVWEWNRTCPFCWEENVISSHTAMKPSSKCCQWVECLKWDSINFPTKYEVQGLKDKNRCSHCVNYQSKCGGCFRSSPPHSLWTSISYHLSTGLCFQVLPVQTQQLVMQIIIYIYIYYNT